MAETPMSAAPVETPTAAPVAAPAKIEAPVVAKDPEVAKSTVQAEIRRLKLKMDGQELDLPEEEVLKLASQAGASQKRFQEAAAIRKHAEEVLSLVKASPIEALTKLGMTPAEIRKISEEYLVESIKREQESPEAKQMREAQEKIRSYEQKEKEREEAATKKAEEDRQAAEKSKQDALTAQWAKKYDEDITAALGKVSVPKTAYTVKRMAQLLQVNSKKGFNMDADSLAKLVQEDYEKEYGEYTSGFKTDKGLPDGAALIKLLGPDKMKAIRSALLADLKKKPQEFAKAVGETPKTEVTGEKISWRDAQRRALRTGR